MTSVPSAPVALRKACGVASPKEKPPLGLLYIWATPLVAGLVHLCTLQVGGLMLSGFVWMAMLGVGILVYLAERSLLPDRRMMFNWLPWLPLVVWVWTSLWWSGASVREGVQDACLLSMPLFVAVVASSCIHTGRQLDVLLKMFAWTIPLLLAGFVIELQKSGGDVNEMGFRMGSLTATLVAAVFLTGTWRGRVRPWIGWGACVLMAAIPGARAATLAMLMMPIIHPTLGRWTTRLVLVGGACLLAVAVFQTSHFQERFFHEGASGNAWDRVNTSGRFEAWPLIWNKAMEEPILGFGIGTTAAYVDRVSELGGHPHNDYLRVVYELGFAGLGLLLCALAWQTGSLIRDVRRHQGVIQHAFAAATIGWILFMLTSATDNTLMYAAAYMNPLFALMGAGSGVAARQRDAIRNCSKTTSGSSDPSPCPLPQGERGLGEIVFEQFLSNDDEALRDAVDDYDLASHDEPADVPARLDIAKFQGETWK